MRHQRKGRRLGVQPDHRRLMLANLACSVLEHERIKTTEAKAKEVKPLVERMITLGKAGDLHSRRLAISQLRNKKITYKLFNEIAPRYAERPGGYTRIVRIGPRLGDGAEMVYLELV
ncbi:MAG: 50S ribosomal protein L17 [Thermoleophilia bacterium]|nr:50S ribosomal protein L17 [Thermoleophilia bacterium]